MKGLHFTTLNEIREKAQNRGPPTKISGLSAVWERLIDFVLSSETNYTAPERARNINNFNIHVIQFFFQAMIIL